MNERQSMPGASYSRYSGNLREERSGSELLTWFRQQHAQMSQQQLANLVGSSRSMIAQMEQGARQPSGKLLTTLSQALQLRDVEQAMLFLSFDKVQAGEVCMLPYVIAALLLDPDLSLDQAEILIELVMQEYRRATGSNAIEQYFQANG